MCLWKLKAVLGSSGISFSLQSTVGEAWLWEAEDRMHLWLRQIIPWGCAMDLESMEACSSTTGQMYLLGSLRMTQGLAISHGGFSNMVLFCVHHHSLFRDGSLRCTACQEAPPTCLFSLAWFKFDVVCGSHVP